MVERPAGGGAVSQKQVACQSLIVVEVVNLVALLELLDDTLEAPVSEVQVLQVTHLGIEGELVTGSGGIESLG